MQILFRLFIELCRQWIYILSIKPLHYIVRLKEGSVAFEVRESDTMNRNTNGLKHYFDPEFSSTKEESENSHGQPETKEWVHVERHGRGASTKLITSKY